MANYVDGFVLPVPKANIESYRKLAEIACKVWMELGALDYVECVAEDVKPGTLTSFPQSVNLEPGEIVVFSWIVYESREARDRITEKAMKDPRLAAIGPDNLPFDGKRMVYGGFEMLVKA
jgi:uncharacterized protein YbaA (DUF1428 family)